MTVDREQSGITSPSYDIFNGRFPGKFLSPDVSRSEVNESANQMQSHGLQSGRYLGSLPMERKIMAHFDICLPPSEGIHASYLRKYFRAASLLLSVQKHLAQEIPVARTFHLPDMRVT